MSRRAALRTICDDAGITVGAFEPDNTESTHNRVGRDELVVTIKHDLTGGLRVTVDDYVANMAVAEIVTEAIRTHTDTNHE